MKSLRALLELAEAHDVPTTKRQWLEVRDEERHEQTTFIDLPRSREEICADLRELGVLPSA